MVQFGAARSGLFRTCCEARVSCSAGWAAGAAPAEKFFVEALESARRSGALSWKPRASLARVRRSQTHPAEAASVLQMIHDRLTEGHGKADPLAAKRLLDELSASATALLARAGVAHAAGRTALRQAGRLVLELMEPSLAVHD